VLGDVAEELSENTRCEVGSVRILCVASSSSELQGDQRRRIISALLIEVSVRNGHDAEITRLEEIRDVEN